MLTLQLMIYLQKRVPVIKGKGGSTLLAVSLIVIISHWGRGHGGRRGLRGGGMALW